jgi:predicted enzyme involved in methoxymalonyl-ACP biosynthesis
MKQQYKNYYQFTKSPKVLLKAKLDNIAIVPASMLPFKETLQELINNLPEGGVFLCHAKKNTRQRKLLERVEEILRQHGHAVMNLSMEQVVSH